MDTETLIGRTQGEWKVHPFNEQRICVKIGDDFATVVEVYEPETQYSKREWSADHLEIKANIEIICKAVNNYDSMMDALSQCHNLFEAEEKNLSDQGKQVWQTVIAAILKATHKT